ncbi:MAG: SRPBCC family protein [Anaerolineales bacterium]
MLHRLTRTQTAAASIEQIWEYFSQPANLNVLTPPDMHFEIIHNDSPRMHPGQLIEYRVKFMPLLRSRWLTEITHVRELAYFVDEQRIGPYRFWYHEHLFQAVPGGTRITDRVTYELPFGPLGNLVHVIWVKHRLNGIFNYRAQKIEQLFGSI